MSENPAQAAPAEAPLDEGFDVGDLALEELPRQGRKTEFFVLVGRTNGRLKLVLEMAQNMSLAAVNASATAVRAGETGKGFIPITRAIDELARDTTRLVRQISRELQALVFLSVAEHQTKRTLDKFEAASTLTDPAKPHYASVARAQARIRRVAEEEGTRLRAQTRSVLEMLGRISLQMRAARYISATALVEAASTDRYRGQLEVVARSVSSTADSIERIIATCKAELQRPANEFLDAQTRGLLL